MHSWKKYWKNLVLATVIVLIAAGMAGVLFPGHGEEIGTVKLPASFLNAAPLSTELNVTVGRVAYITQPTEWLFSKISPQSMSIVNRASTWTLNNSGYFFMVNNSTTATAPSPQIANFNLANSIGSTVSYAFFDSRVAFNGTGDTGYVVASEAAQTAVPAGSANNVQATSAGAAVNQVDVQFSESSGAWTVTVGYYAWAMGGNSKAYENYTTTAISGVSIQPEWFYDIYINIQAAGTVVSVVNSTGTVLGYTSSLPAVAGGNISKIAYLSYETAPAASTSGDMFILDYAYYVNHNIGPASAPLAGAMSGIDSMDIAPFDPNATAANYTESPNATNSYTSVNMSTSDFTSVTPSSSNATMTSSLINASYLPGSSASTIYAGNQTAALRTTPESATTISASLYVTTWTPQGIQSAIQTYLQDYIGNKIGVIPSQITVVSYLIDNIGFDMNFSSSTASMIQDYIYNSAPGIMQSDGISLVNSTTGAVAAGADIGDFMSIASGIIAQPVINGNEIMNPLTGAIYYTPEQAGFPIGSSIMNGAISVPGQYQFYGFAADGSPMFAAGWNPFAGLTGAASAVSNFFHGAASTVNNAIGHVANAVSPYIEKLSGLTTTPPSSITSKFTSDLSNAVGHVMPFLGGAATDISKSIGGTLFHAMTGVGSGLASIRNSVTGALATGATNVKNTIYHIGSTIRNSAGAFGQTVWNGLGKARSVVGSVISPLTTGIKNLPGLLSGGMKSLISDGRNALNTVGNSLAKTVSGVSAWAGNVFGQMTNGFMNSTVGAFVRASTTPALSFFAGLTSTLGHYLIPILIGGFVIILLIAFVVIHDRNKRHHHGNHRKR